ncbi:MAG TPA: crossover junction endodeoxyribonuclease RuvC [Acidimicrobiia bacterium]|nr:crossover junction endodeoxyribonuclease RuvC [Acidimicrobiia bacterium]
MFDSGATRVLGVDPGLSRCGYGVVEQVDGHPRAVAAGVLTTPVGTPVPARLRELAEELELVMAEHQPNVVAVERVLFQANARTAMAVGQASGMALLVAARRGLPVVEYSPNEVKHAVAGYGGADKAQVQAMVQAVLRLSERPDPPDVADALALALCHLNAAPLQAQVAAATADRGRVPGLDHAIAAALAKEAG